MSWPDLEEELGYWSTANRRVPLWWRDDDASDTSPALDRLLDLADEYGLGLGLAVIPAAATLALSQRLATTRPDVRVLQHGYSHQNHAPQGERFVELGLHRPAMMVAGEMGTGWLALERLFAERALPIMVPPWNRIAPSLIPILPEIGYRGLSTLGPRPRVHAAPGLLQVNVHVDIIDWRGGRQFAGDAAVIGALVAAMRQRRGDRSSTGPEPIGLLTHHLVMDESAWVFMHRLFNQLKMVQAVSILPPHEAFAAVALSRTLSQ